MAGSICEAFLCTAKRLTDLGLGYLTLDRAASTLSTGELQRVQLTRAVRNRTTGVLYVLDEPSIGLHPSNVDGLLGVVDDLIADGNSVIVVDHDVRVLRQCDLLRPSQHPRFLRRAVRMPLLPTWPPRHRRDPDPHPARRQQSSRRLR